MRNIRAEGVEVQQFVKLDIKAGDLQEQINRLQQELQKTLREMNALFQGMCIKAQRESGETFNIPELISKNKVNVRIDHVLNIGFGGDEDGSNVNGVVDSERKDDHP